MHKFIDNLCSFPEQEQASGMMSLFFEDWSDVDILSRLSYFNEDSQSAVEFDTSTRTHFCGCRCRLYHTVVNECTPSPINPQCVEWDPNRCRVFGLTQHCLSSDFRCASVSTQILRVRGEGSSLLLSLPQKLGKCLSTRYATSLAL